MFDPRSRWILILNLVKLFWRHWRKEFLATLNTQMKWREATDNLKVGDVVFVVDQNAPIGRWQFFRIRMDRYALCKKLIHPTTLCLLNVADQP